MCGTQIRIDADEPTLWAAPMIVSAGSTGPIAKRGLGTLTSRRWPGRHDECLPGLPEREAAFLSRTGLQGVSVQQFTRRRLLSSALAAGTFSGTLPDAQGWVGPDSVFVDGLGGPLDDEAGKPTRWKPSQVAVLKESGMSAWMVVVNDVTADADAWNRTIDKLSFYSALIASNADIFVQARSVADVRAARQAGRTALIFGTENTAMMGADLGRVTTLSNLGVRVMQLTYNIRNMCGDGALEPANGGLSNFGREMIDRIEHARMVLDLSHGGDRTILEAVACAKRPMSIDHTGCRAVGNHPRNVTDAAIKAVADKGGVVGLYFMPYLTPGRPPTRADVIAHLEHAVGVGGEEHVSIGTDNFLDAQADDEKARALTRKSYRQRVAAGIAAPGESPDFFPAVRDYNSPMRFHMLADDLAKRGWSSARIEKVLGGNLLRVYEEVWGA